MVDQPNAGGDKPPPFFTTVKGWIVGLSGVIIALAGLVGAYKQLVPERKAEAATNMAATGAQPVAAAAIPSQPEEDAPLVYEGDDAKMEWIDDKWVLETSEGRWDYVDEYSKYEGYVLAYDKTNAAYMRWPIKGGMAEQRKDGQGWEDWTNLYPAEAAGDAEAVE